MAAAIALTGCLIASSFAGAELCAELGRKDLALRLPFGAAAVARAGLNAQGDDRADRIALAALSTSPMIEPALITLGWEDPGRPVASTDRRRKLKILAGRMGWRNVEVQRQLYNMALMMDDYPGAMTHADAILRTTGKEPNIEFSLSVAANIPSFRAAMIPHFQYGPAWSRRWLVTYVNALSDEAVVDLVMATGNKRDQPFEAAATRIMWTLAHAGRLEAALQIDAQMGAKALSLPMKLAWDDPAPNVYSSPFAWQFGKGYAVSNDATRKLMADQAEQTALIYRLLPLPPGDYELTFRSGQPSTEDWTWAMGCGSRPVAVNWKLEIKNAFTVDEDCPLQWLAVRGGPTAPPLTAMTIATADEEFE